MDLSISQDLMRMQDYMTEYGSHVFKVKETFGETDIKGNNILFNSSKTETNSTHGHDPGSLFEVKTTQEKALEVDNALFSYSSFKKAMDLRTNNGTVDERKRTIFDDAEFYAKNYCYKLLPITFEQVDETVIQSEHNYSLSSLNCESESEEDCSRTLDYSQIKEKNYKRRRTKFREESAIESASSDGNRNPEIGSMVFHQDVNNATQLEHRSTPENFITENSTLIQPLDLSASPVVQEEKTDNHLRCEPPDSIGGDDEVAQPDSDKENVNSELSGIRVTITRPDEKENYQPCDLFLNDIARLVPWLIDKDCFEVDILDRTCEQHEEFGKHRLYYVISEATWRLFQRSNERVILTNDQSLGQPLRKADKDERPSYLIFDQVSLAKCLADYCREIGGCFEYTCVEEGKNDDRPKAEPGNEVKKVPDTMEENKTVDEKLESTNKIEGVENKYEKEHNEMAGKEEEKKEPNEGKQLKSDSKLIETVKEKKKESSDENEETKVTPKYSKFLEKKILAGKETEKGFAFVPEEKISKEIEFIKPKPVNEEVNGGKPARLAAAGTKESKKRGMGYTYRKKSPVQPEPKHSRITTRSKPTSKLETSHKSDKPITTKERIKPGSSALSKELPRKRNKKADPEDLRTEGRKTRSGKLLGEVTTKNLPGKRKGIKALKEEKSAEAEERRGKEARRFSLRSQKTTLEQGNAKKKKFSSKPRARARKR